MLMPVAPVDEHHGPEPGEHQIGRSRKVAAMQPESEAERVGDGADDPLGRGVMRADAPHRPASCFGREVVHFIPPPPLPHRLPRVQARGVRR